jgi:vacuole morphology and inheritance protein 14
MELVELTKQEVDLSQLIERLTLHLVHEDENTRMTSHRWICMLLEKYPKEMNVCVDEYFFALLRTLEDKSDSIVIMSLRNLALISREEVSFRRVLVKIVELFGSTRVIGQTSLLEHRGSLIIRHLCNLLSPEKVYCELSTILSDDKTNGITDSNNSGGSTAAATTTASKNDNHRTVYGSQDLEFCELMVQMLNLILLTANELEPMRTKLKGSLTSSRDSSLFETIFNAWCHSPVSALSLCFLAQSYDLASVMISNFGDAEITVGLLMQVGK